MDERTPFTDEELLRLNRDISTGEPIYVVTAARLVADLRACRAELASFKELVWGNECGCVGSAFKRAGVEYG